MDLSRNNLSGKIPRGIENLAGLKFLNLSFNDLEGEIPTNGVFRNISAISFAGNSKLQLTQCPTAKVNNDHKLIIVVVCVALFLCCNNLFGHSIYWRRKKLKVPTTSLEEEKLTRISYLELHKATNGFSLENLIGSGSFGTVYKGKLNQQVNELVAVKVLNLQNNRAAKRFVAECKILRSIKHKNLFKILTYCSRIDSRHDEFKALIYKFIPNGSLDIWLHPDETNTSTTLNLLQRLNIATDVASALHYLHSNCEPPIIHCDLKPSNILLDVEMCAHVGDFGLPPDYGTGGEISTRGDVYSYGILLLEMITGRRPTCDIFKDDFNLHNYVKIALLSQILEIVDPTLLNERGEQGEVERRENVILEVNDQRQLIESTPLNEFEKIFISILTIALSCSEEYPTNRIDMNYVIKALHRVKGAMLSNGRNRL